MIVTEPLLPIDGHAAVTVRIDVQNDGCLVVETTMRVPGMDPQVTRDVHSAHYSLAIAREVVARQASRERAAKGGERG